MVPDAVLAHDGQEAEGVTLAAVIDHHLIPVLGDHRYLDPAFLDDAERIGGRRVLLQDHRVLGIKFHGQVSGNTQQIVGLEELERRHLLQKGHHVIEDHIAARIRL
jgi:hypothetical protein